MERRKTAEISQIFLGELTLQRLRTAEFGTRQDPEWDRLSRPEREHAEFRSRERVHPKG